jgi:hypothetical protein
LEEIVVGDNSTPGRTRSKKDTFAKKVREIGTGLMIVSKATFGFDLKNGGGGIRHFGDPYKLAKKLFMGLRKGQASSLYMSDFEPFFADTLERVEAFKVFDVDENGFDRGLTSRRRDKS